MAYKTVSGAQSAEIELDGSVYTVNFGHSYKYYAVRNDSSGTIYVSTTDKNCTPKNDGVVSIPSGGSYVHYNGYGGNSEIYFSGSGGAVVITQDDPNNPFRKAQKGGGGNAGSNILPHSEGLAAYFDYSKNVSGTGWTDIVSGLTLEADFVLGNDFISPETTAQMPALLNNPYTVYVICKQNTPKSQWSGVFVTNNNIFGVYHNDNKIGVFNPPNGTNSYLSNISSLNYHVCALTFYHGLCSLYIDGVLSYTAGNRSLPDIPYVINSIADYKMIALCDNAAHGPKYIAENTNYLAQKYEIEI